MFKFSKHHSEKEVYANEVSYMQNKYKLCIVVSSVFFFTSCGVINNSSESKNIHSTIPKIGVANPASVYCVDKGGRLEIKNSTHGQYGLCHLPNGDVVEEWELYRRSHNKS